MFARKAMCARVCLRYTEARASLFVCSCVCSSCRDLVAVVCLSISPAGLEEAGGCTTVALLLPLKPLLPPSLPVLNISQHSRLLQLSRVHPREDECAVTMLVENTLYKPCTGPYCVCVCVLFVYLGHCGEQCASSLGFTWVQSLRDTQPAFDCLCLLNVCVCVCRAPVEVCTSLSVAFMFVFFPALFSLGVLLFPFHISLSVLVWWIKS